MRFALMRGNVDTFAELLEYHWSLSKKVNSGSTNTLIAQIFSAIKNMIAGLLVCGVGGGWFRLVVLKRRSTANVLEASDTWYGVIYKEDKAAVADSFRKLIADGIYRERTIF